MSVHICCSLVGSLLWVILIPPSPPAGEHVEEERVAVNDETDMLDSLTGIPLSEDEILFAVPVCAPYATLLNYKFKGELVNLP